MKKAGHETRAASTLWILDLLVFVILAAGILLEYSFMVIGAFILLAILQNFWRPILISRVAALSDPAQTATILSIESQSKSLFVAIFAPLIGLAIDTVSKFNADWRFLPIAGLGIMVSVLMVVTAGGVKDN